MTAPEEPMPTMSESQRIGMLADREFRHDLSDHWIDSSSAQRDFGWDYWITQRETGTGHVGSDFFVQLKGTGCPGLVADGEFLAQELEVTTIHYLLSRGCPALLAVCDLEDPERPLYWVWVEEALKGVTRPWQQQKSVTLHVPRANRLRDSHARIQQEATRWIEERKIDQALAEAVALAVPDVVQHAAADTLITAQATAKQRALAAFAEADLVDLGPDGLDATTVSAPERAIRAKLREAKTLIDSYNYQAAATRLAEVEEDLASTPVAPATWATFHNRRAVILLRRMEYQQAAELFGRAVDAAPDDERYQCNLIMAETLLSGNASDRRQEWLSRLDAVLTRKPDYDQAIIMKTRLIATENPSLAEEFLTSSSYWARDPSEARLLLADVVATSNPTRALEELGKLPSTTAATSQALALKGFLLFRKAIGVSRSEPGPTRGFGPADLKLPLLERAASAYEEACEGLARIGYPGCGEDVFRNAVQVLVTAGRPRTALRLCEPFLVANPESLPVLEAAAVALNVLGRHDTAVDYLTRCVDGQPHDEIAFRNLLMALYAADRYTELHERATKRLSASLSRAEEATCREFLALAAAELGKHDEAASHLGALAILDGAAAVPPTAAVWARLGRSPDEIRAMLREKSERYPTDTMIATHLAMALLPVSAASAAEIRQLLGRVSTIRQLSPLELRWLGRAYAEMGEFERAEQTFRHGVSRFPDDLRLPFDLAVTLSDLGRVDEAYEVMTTAAQSQPSSPPIQQNLALLARATGRLDQAIELFEQACQRVQGGAARRPLAGQLFELRRLRGDSGTELLRAAIQFGDRSAGEDLSPELEARFLIMALLAGTASLDSDSQDVRRWAAHVRERLGAFCDKYPKHDALRRFRIPEGADAQALEMLVFSEIYAQAYPSLLLGQQLEITARSVPYPLCVRARKLPASAGTTVSYWQLCVASGDRAHRVHCVIDNTLESETAEVPLGQKIIVDVTALLTLKHLGLLDEALACFTGWIIVDETRHVIDAEALGYPVPNPLAREMTEWLLAHRQNVAVRRLARHGSEQTPKDRFVIAPSGLWVSQRVPETALLPDGVGASMRLAAQLGMALYTDEGVVRQWAGSQLEVKSFGTVAFLGCLRRRGNLTLYNEATLISRLLTANYRNVPYGAPHIHAAIRDVLEQFACPPNSADLNEDPVAGVLLRHLGDPEMNDEAVVRASGELLAMCIKDEAIPAETTDDLAYSLSFKNQQRVPGGVLDESRQESPGLAVAKLWAYVLVALHQTVPELERAWSLMRKTANGLYHGNAVAARIPQLVATIAVGGIRQSRIDADAGDQILLRVATAIPTDERGLWFAAIQSHKPRRESGSTG